MWILTPIVWPVLLGVAIWAPIPMRWAMLTYGAICVIFAINFLIVAVPLATH